jgi:hypothetical protein
MERAESGGPVDRVGDNYTTKLLNMGVRHKVQVGVAMAGETRGPGKDELGRGNWLWNLAIGMWKLG